MRAVVALIGSLAVVAASCGGGTSEQEFELRIYDPTGKVPVELTSADIVRSSAEASPVGGEYAMVSFALTDTGTSKFCRLTRAVARRGRELGKRQALAIEINGRVESRPRIDHDATPDGICGAPGFEIQGMRPKKAQALVTLIRGAP
jgi:SecDF, P1 head subdomain